MPVRNMVEAVPDIIACLQNAVREAVMRRTLVIGLTAGFDSRLIAAIVHSLPEIHDRVQFITFQDDWGCPAGHPDITGAKSIAETIGLPHSVVEASEASTAHANAARASEAMQATRFEAWGEVANFPGSFIISSWASEVGRAYYRWPGWKDSGAYDAQNVTGLANLPEFRAEAEDWATGASRVQERFGLPVADLLYWELRVGRWNAAAFNIMNIGGGDWLTLYSCRRLFELMLSIPEKQRGKKGHDLYVALIGQLCPALLNQAFSPPTLWERGYFLRVRARHAVANLLLALGLLDVVRKMLRRAS